MDKIGHGKKKMILKLLEPLFEMADAEGLAFFCHYQSLWFSPDELRECHANDRFLWGPSNWLLRHPSERLTELKWAFEKAEADLTAGQKWVASFKKEAAND